MNREIKFRGQKVVTKEWVYGSLISTKEHGYAIVQQMSNPIQNGVIQGWCFGVIPETVGQFTGLTDKNSKECYEGDLSIIEGNLCEVKFGTFFTCGWDFKIIGKMGSYNMGDVCRSFDAKGCKDFEVIGNIYENPELLCN